MNFIDVLRGRHSVRDFDGKPVPDEDIRTIVEEAGLAPSWADSQPWRVYAATGKTMDRIRTEHEKLVADGTKGSADFASIHRTLWGEQARTNMSAFSDQLRHTLKADSAESSQEKTQHGSSSSDKADTPRSSTDSASRPAHPSAMRMANGRLFNTGTAFYLTLQPQITSWNVLDLGAFEQTITLAAKNLGYDTMIAYEFVRFPTSVKKIMGIPESEILAIGIAVGHASDAPINSLRARRMPIDTYLTIKD